jgi:hypothetical protein
LPIKQTCCSVEEGFVEKLNEINKLVEELRMKIARTRLTVNEYCSDLTNDVDIATETKIENAATPQEKYIDVLNNERRRLLKEIKDYEAECMVNVEATRGKLLESIDAASKWASLMLKPTSLARYVDFEAQLNEQAHARLCHLEHLILQIKAFQFGGKLMKFNASKCNLEIGTLTVFKLRTPKLIEHHFKDTHSRKYNHLSITNKNLI